MEETNLLTVSECEDIVRRCLKSENVQNLRFVVIRLQNQNFLLRITVNHNSEEKTLNFFAKSALKKPKIIQILFDDFKKTIPKFDTKITPKFYYGKSDLLLFEDLTWQGYQTHPSMFTLDHVEAVLKVLAKFHAGSFAYEEIKAKETSKEYRLSQDYKLVHSIVDLKKSQVVDIISSLLTNKSEENVVEAVTQLEEKQLSSKFRRTLCHGHLILENIMFKNTREGPTECKLLNFKSKLYTAPVCDVLQVIFFNTNEDLRQHHFDFLLTRYYQHLKEELEKYSIQVELIVPREEWQAQAHFFLPLIKLKEVLHNGRLNEELKEDLNCSILSRQDCYTIIRNKTGTTDYKMDSFRVTPLDQVNGYLGNYHKLQIKIFRETEETIDCFVKCMPKNPSSKGIVEETGCFFKEIFIYQTLVPQMLDLGIDTIKDCLPRCFFHRNEDLAVFEDVTVKNYRTLPAQIPFDLPLLTLVARRLAQFHASTIVFEEKKSEELKRQYRLGEEYEDYLQEVFFSKDKKHSGAILMQTGVRSVLDVVNLFPELKLKNEDNFKRAWPKLQEIFFEVIKPSTCYRNVVSHGDLWTNNIMIRFDDQKPVDCCFVDFQIIRYCPLAQDFLSIIYLTTDRATRMKHERKLALIYYEEFARVLGLHNYKVEKIYPFEEFVETMNLIQPQITVQAIMWFMFIICTSEEISSFLADDETCRRVFFEDRKDYLEAMCQKSVTFKNKLRECVLDLYDLCNSLFM